MRFWITLGNVVMLLLVMWWPYQAKCDACDLLRCSLAPGNGSVFSKRHLECWRKDGCWMVSSPTGPNALCWRVSRLANATARF